MKVKIKIFDFSDGPAHFDPSDFPSLAPGVGSSMAGVGGNRSNYGKIGTAHVSLLYSTQ